MLSFLDPLSGQQITPHTDIYKPTSQRNYRDPLSGSCWKSLQNLPQLQEHPVIFVWSWFLKTSRTLSVHLCVHRCSMSPFFLMVSFAFLLHTYIAPSLWSVWHESQVSVWLTPRCLKPELFRCVSSATFSCYSSYFIGPALKSSRCLWIHMTWAFSHIFSHHELKKKKAAAPVQELTCNIPNSIIVCRIILPPLPQSVTNKDMWKMKCQHFKTWCNWTPWLWGCRVFLRYV